MVATFTNWEPWQSKLVEDLIVFEGFRAHLYDDATGKPPVKSWVGNLTTGYGWNIEGAGINTELGLIVLKYQVEKVATELSQRFHWFVKLSQDRKRAIGNLSFNMGIGRLLGFKKALRAMEYHTFEIAANELLDSRWAKQVSKDRVDFVVNLIRKG